MNGVLTLGETMGLLTTPASGRLPAGATMEFGIGGAESNVAIALARLGVEVTWAGRVGDDSVGGAVLRELRGEGVHVVAERDPYAPTGLMLKERARGEVRRVRYYRGASAAAAMGPDFVAHLAAVMEGTAVLHVTGITPALGPGPAAAVESAIALARSTGTLVSVDVNHRRALWSDEAARPVLAALVASADLVFAGCDEAAVVLGRHGETTAPTEMARSLADLGPRTVVIKLGADGALAIDHDRIVTAPARPLSVVDPVGAGDAFVGGYLTALLEGEPVAGALALGNAVAGVVVSTPGDWEGLPTRAELDLPTGTEVVR